MVRQHGSRPVIRIHICWTAIVGILVTVRLRRCPFLSPKAIFESWALTQGTFEVLRAVCVALINRDTRRSRAARKVTKNAKVKTQRLSNTAYSRHLARAR